MLFNLIKTKLPETLGQVLVESLAGELPYVKLGSSCRGLREGWSKVAGL